MVYAVTHDSDIHNDVTRISLSDDAPPDRVVIDDAHFLLTAHFKKAGTDLILTGDDGRKVVLEGYFNLLKRPDLSAPDGGSLTLVAMVIPAAAAAPGRRRPSR